MYYRLAQYAQFLLNNRLSEMASGSVKKSRENQLPLMDVLNHYTEFQLHQMAEDNLRVILTAIAEHKGLEVVTEKYKHWASGKDTLLSDYKYVVEDIIIINDIRKSLLIEFLKDYASGFAEYEPVLLEIENLFSKIHKVAFQSFATWQENRHLRESTFIQTILDAAINAIVALQAVRDNSGNITDFEYRMINKHAEVMMGKTNTWITGKKLLDEFPGVVKMGLFEKYISTVETGERSEIQFYYPFENFNTWFRQSINKWQDGLVILTTDITQDKIQEEALRQTLAQLSNTNEELRKTQEELRNVNRHLEEMVHSRTEDLEKSQEQLQLIINTLPDLLSYVDRNYTFKFANIAYEEWFGIARDKIVGKELADLLGREVFKTLKNYADRALKGEIVSFQMGLNYPKAGFKHINAKYIPDKARDGSIRGLVILVSDITDVMRTQENLSIQSRVLESMDEGVSISDEDGFIIYTNQAEDRMFGYEPGELNGQHVSILNAYPPGENEKIVMEVIQQLKTSGNWHGEWYNRRKNGEKFYTNAHITALHIGDKSLWVSVQQDITEEKKYKEALAYQHKVNKTITDNATSCLLMVDQKGYCTFINPAGEKILGFTFDEIRQKPLHNMIHHHYPDGSIYPREQCPIDNALPENSTIRSHKDSFFRKDGTMFPVICSVSPIFENGIPVATVIEVQDVTEEQRMTESLRQNENQLKIIANSIPAFVAYINKEFRYVFTNEYYCNLNNVHGEAKGKLIEEVIGTEAFSISKPNIIKALNGESRTYENTVTLKDGSAIEVEVRLVPDKDENGEVRGAVIMGIDLTERLQFQRQLSETNTQLTRINSDLDNFIYTASHDLKAPISNIEGLLNTLKDSIGTDPGEEVRMITNMMAVSIQKFKNIIQDLTDINKVQKNISGEISEIDILSVVEDVKLSIRDLIVKSDAEIITDTSRCPFINFSSRNFHSIILNLLSNSIKYRFPGRKPVIKINSYISGSYSVLEVSDNGLGIKPEHKDKIFGMFKRLYDHVEGTGIGLYIVKRMIDNSGGKIEVDSEIDKGTTFRIYFLNL